MNETNFPELYQETEHIIKNKLGALKGYLNLVKTKLDNSELKNFIEKADQITNSINQLLIIYSKIAEVAKKFKKETKVFSVSSSFKKIVTILNQSGIKATYQPNREKLLLFGNQFLFEDSLLTFFQSSICKNSQKINFSLIQKLKSQRSEIKNGINLIFKIEESGKLFPNLKACLISIRKNSDKIKAEDYPFFYLYLVISYLKGNIVLKEQAKILDISFPLEKF